MSADTLPMTETAPIVEGRSHQSWTISETLVDPGWDEYLLAHSCGQFQQSTLWAKVKAAEGWSVARIELRQAGRLAGGAQILYRRSRLGRFGYVAKGPVVSDASGMRQMLDQVGAVVRKLGLKAVVIQGPDFWPGDPSIFSEGGGQRECLMGVIDATLAVDLEKPIETLRSEMDRHTRQSVRQASERGITVREGDDRDIELFFELMLESCRRQQTNPNPANAQRLRELWRAFHDGRTDARLTFAVADGKEIAGLFCLVFGNRLSIWKKGWRNVDSRLKPNHLLYAEAIEWGKKRGLKWCDFGSLDRSIAEALSTGRPVPPEHNSGRDTFHISFGGRPFLFPVPYIHFRSFPLRLAYGAALASGIPEWWQNRRQLRHRNGRGS
jgi:hypothetical protein